MPTRRLQQDGCGVSISNTLPFCRFWARVDGGRRSTLLTPIRARTHSPCPSAAQAAATLLLLFHQLPTSFMPPSVSAVLMRCVPPYPAAAALLSESMAPAEWASARHVLSLLREALAPAAAAHNGLTVHVRGPGTGACWDALLSVHLGVRSAEERAADVCATLLSLPSAPLLHAFPGYLPPLRYLPPLLCTHLHAHLHSTIVYAHDTPPPPTHT
jgi:hypothetical protein